MVVANSNAYVAVWGTPNPFACVELLAINFHDRLIALRAIANEPMGNSKYWGCNYDLYPPWPPHTHCNLWHLVHRTTLHFLLFCVDVSWDFRK